MTDSDRSDARKTSRFFILATVLVFVALALLIVFRGCHEDSIDEDRLDPNDPLPGTQDATGYHFAPDAEPLLTA